MKHLVHGAAFVAALAVAAPVWAQGQGNPPAGGAAAANMPPPSDATAPRVQRPKRHVRRTPRYTRSYPDAAGYYSRPGWPTDHMADELNRAELQGYGVAAPYGYAPPAPYAPYAPYPPQPYYRGY